MFVSPEPSTRSNPVRATPLERNAFWPIDVTLSGMTSVAVRLAQPSKAKSLIVVRDGGNTMFVTAAAPWKPEPTMDVKFTQGLRSISSRPEPVNVFAPSVVSPAPKTTLVRAEQSRNAPGDLLSMSIFVRVSGSRTASRSDHPWNAPPVMRMRL